MNKQKKKSTTLPISKEATEKTIMTFKISLKCDFFWFADLTNINQPAYET